MKIEKLLIPLAVAGFGATAEAQQPQQPETSPEKPTSPEQSTPTREEVKQQVVQIIGERLGVPHSRIKEATHITKQLGADSLDIVELIMEMEKEFGIGIPDAVAETVGTVGEAIEVVYTCVTDSVVLYAEADLQGESLRLIGPYSPFFYPAGTKKEVLPGGLSSLHIPQGYMVVLYAEEKFRGDFLIFNAKEKAITINDLDAIDPAEVYDKTTEAPWNDRCISIRILRKE